VVDDAVDLYEPLAEELGVRLTKRTGPAVQINGNAHLLSQALANLIDNAIKYTPAGGSIEVACERVDGIAVLAVCDTGPGIPTDQRGEVLKRFTRLENSRSAAGSGLGLSLVAAVARLHQANIELSDASPGLIVRLRFG
jgi:signal transduction histidine kinase